MPGFVVVPETYVTVLAKPQRGHIIKGRGGAGSRARREEKEEKYELEDIAKTELERMMEQKEELENLLWTWVADGGRWTPAVTTRLCNVYIYNGVTVILQTLFARD